MLLAAGCATSGNAHRSREKTAVLAGLDPQVRNHVQGGFVEITYTTDMVYVALGSPSRIDHKPSPDGDVEIWIYKNMALPTGPGFQGLRYNPDFDITPSPITGIIHSGNTRPRPDAQQGSKSSGGQGYGVNLDALDAATTLPDLPMGTLYRFFYNGRVFKMALGR